MSVLHTPDPAGTDATLLTRLIEVARAHPGRTAFLQGDVATSYGSLLDQIARLGESLKAEIAPGDRVVLAMDNSAEFAIGVYAVWWAGGVSVALNPTLKPADIERLSVASQARIRWHELPSQAAPGAPPSDSSPRLIAGDALASLVFTSGTTGDPKGVMLSHQALAANTLAVQQTLPMSPDDITLCVLPFHYAFGSSVLHTHLSLGATLVLENSFMYPQRIVQRMAEVSATHFYGVPSSFYLLLDRGQLAAHPLPTLRHVAQAGGPMAPDRIARFLQAVPGVGFWVMYGQTEACSRLTTLRPEQRQLRPDSVGRPLPGISLEVRDASGRPLPAGQVGDIWAQGPNLMSGYWQAPEDTAAVLVDHWLHTGDIGHLDDEGFLFLHGRSREILKVGAHRVSPHEIERCVQAVTGVSECAVLPLPDAMLGEVVRACVVPAPCHPPLPQLTRDIQRHCREHLALHKVPKQIDYFDALPRTASGKVQKHLIDS
jgi:acyl-CoA synthetase (AMP-forming)/AMP-acid ligase II